MDTPQAAKGNCLIARHHSHSHLVWTGATMSKAAMSGAVGESAMRKALWRILPLILLAYLCAYMDRVNVSFAAVQMNVDLKFSATIFGLGGGLFFLGYALFEIPSNMMAVRYGSRSWLARIMITWGLLSAAMMVVHTPMQFYLMRFLLGVAEAGFFPGVIFYFGSWFPSSHRGRAVSRFYVASPLASVVMGAISGPLLGFDGLAGLRGWQWLFLVQGLPSVLIGLILLRYLPERPDTVAWLTAPEKGWIEGELAREAALIGEPEGHNALASLRNPKVILLSAMGFLYIGVVTTVVLSAPLLLLAKTGLDAKHVGYLVTLGGVLGAVTMLVAGDFADRHGDRFLNAFWLTVVMGAALLVMALARAPVIEMAAYLAFAASCFAIAMLVSSGWAEVLHFRELAVGAAAINTVCQLGAFVMPFAWGAARDATGGYTAGLVTLVVFSMASAMLTILVRNVSRVRAPVAVPA
jgi:ACS family tartrate transporter-like MFS transporter